MADSITAFLRYTILDRCTLMAENNLGQFLSLSLRERSESGVHVQMAWHFVVSIVGIQTIRAACVYAWNCNNRADRMLARHG